MAQRTEKAIADALKKLLAKRPLSKITISDIANECGINRMTFYYHYRDVYDLIKTSARSPSVILRMNAASIA